MIKKISQKRNTSSTQVLKTLLVLLEGDYNMNELINKLNEKESRNVFNNSVVSKYINTCRYSGIDIPKIFNRYYITKLPFGLELLSDDIEALQELQFSVRNSMTKKFVNLFDDLIDKIGRFSNRRIARIDKGSFEWSFELFERSVAQKRKIKLLFKNREELVCVPISIVEINNKKFFKVFNKRERLIDTSRLSGVKTTDEKFIDSPENYETGVIYKLKEPLASRYELREHEIMQSLDSESGEKTILSKGENKELLFSRLLRYDSKCEILSPQNYRDEMKLLISNMLANYKE